MTNRAIVTKGSKYVNGLQISIPAAGTKLVTVKAGACRNSTNINDIVLDNDIVINGAETGANGVDITAIVLNQLYAVYAIADSNENEVAGAILSLDFVNGPILPFNYDMYQLIGAVRVNGSANTVAMETYGEGQVRTMYYDEAVPFLSAGTATTLTNVPLATGVPPIRGRALLQVSLEANVVSDTLNLSAFGVPATNPAIILSAVTATPSVLREVVTCPYELNAGVPTISYFVSDASDSADISVIGYEIALS